MNGTTPPNQKRKSNAQPQNAGPRKRIRSPKNATWNSTATHHAPGFWDSLPHIYLTHSAIEEFNRRNALSTVTVLGNDHTGSAENFQRKAPGSLKRFARIGGPDLRDTKGVCPTMSTDILFFEH